MKNVMSDKDLSVNQRVKFLIDQYAMLTQRAFAEKIGVSQSAISSLFSQRENRPGLEMLQKIAIAYPAVSLDWLLLGQGEMLRGQAPTPAPLAVELVQLIQEYMQVSKQLEGVRASYREVSANLNLLHSRMLQHETAIQLQIEALSHFKQESQESLQQVIQQQQQPLAQLRERHASFLLLQEQAEEELLKTIKRQGELEKRLGEFISSVVPLTAEEQMGALALRQQLVQAAGSPAV